MALGVPVVGCGEHLVASPVLSLASGQQMADQCALRCVLLVPVTTATRRRRPSPATFFIA